MTHDPTTLTLFTGAINAAFLHGGAELNLTPGPDAATVDHILGVTVFGQPGQLKLTPHRDNTAHQARFTVFLEAENEKLLQGFWNSHTPDQVAELTAYLRHPALARALGLGRVVTDAYDTPVGIRKDGLDYPFGQFPERASLDALNAAARQYDPAFSWTRHAPVFTVSRAAVMVGHDPAYRFDPDHLIALSASRIDRDDARDALQTAALESGVEYDAALRLLGTLRPAVAASFADETWLATALEAISEQRPPC